MTSRLPLTALLAVSSLGLSVACGSSSRSAFTEDSSGINPGSGLGGGGQLQAGDAGAGEVDTTEYTPPTDLGCSTRAQDILIVDFRSGWWAGGGGGAFSGVALPAVVGACPGTSVDYHHFETSTHVKCVYKSGSGGSCQNLAAAVTVADIRASFEKPSVADYTQIWVLSGSDQDPTDIPVGDALFQGVVGDTAGACIPMLIAAGDGFVTHANTITQDLGMGAAFTQQTNPPSFFSVAMGGAKETSKITAFKSHLLFKGVTALTDQVGSFFGSAHGDSLSASFEAPTIYDVIATDSAGRPTIAVGAAKRPGDTYRPFILDSGWQRTYALGQDPGTDQYLKNIVMYLSLVGCKAAPIAAPH